MAPPHIEDLDRANVSPEAKLQILAARETYESRLHRIHTTYEIELQVVHSIAHFQVTTAPASASEPALPNSIKGSVNSYNLYTQAKFRAGEVPLDNSPNLTNGKRMAKANQFVAAEFKQLSNEELQRWRQLAAEETAIRKNATPTAPGVRVDRRKMIRNECFNKFRSNVRKWVSLTPPFDILILIHVSGSRHWISRKSDWSFALYIQTTSKLAGVGHWVQQPGYSSNDTYSQRTKSVEMGSAVGFGETGGSKGSKFMLMPFSSACLERYNLLVR